MSGRITTRCPACHFTTLVINCGQLICTWHKCPDPTLIHRQGETEAAAENNIDDGGPAFPHFVPEGHYNGSVHYPGMSRLDYFAGKALANSAIAHSGIAENETAEVCYRQAIAMLNERERINAATH